jgi:hypothetical protein
MYAVVGHAGSIAMGRNILPDVLTVLWSWRLAGTVPCTNKKTPVLPLHPRTLREYSRRGPEQHF